MDTVDYSIYSLTERHLLERAQLHGRTVRRSVFVVMRYRTHHGIGLLMTRKPKHANAIHPIGGKVEEDETALLALRREIQEEVGNIPYQLVPEEPLPYHMQLTEYADGSAWLEVYYLAEGASADAPAGKDVPAVVIYDQDLPIDGRCAAGFTQPGQTALNIYASAKRSVFV